MATCGELARPSCDADMAEILHARQHILAGPTKLCYEWQTAVLGPLEYEPWPADAGTLEIWSARVWQRYAGRFAPHGPYFCAAPRIEIVEVTNSARKFTSTCVWEQHRIELHSQHRSRAVVLHELCHAITWWDGHGQDFCGALAWLWRAVLRIPRHISWTIADGLQLPVNRMMPDLPQLPTRFIPGRCGCPLGKVAT